MDLRTYIHNHIDADFGDQEFPFSVTRECFEKGHVFTSYSEIPHKVHFLRKGIVEVNIWLGEEEKVLDFFFEHSFFGSYSALLKGTPSDVYIAALTPCEVDTVMYDDMKQAYTKSLMANKLERIETEKLYMKKVQREKELLTLPAEEQYKRIIKEQPQIITEIPVNKIAKYLGIRPESLSRIRKQIIS